MPWVKLYTEILDDCKVGSLSDDLKWRFVSLICLAGECDANGCLVSGTGAMSAEQIAWRLRITAEALKKDLTDLSSAGLVILEGDIWTVKNFAKRQGRAQYEKREKWREQKADSMDNPPPDFGEDSARNRCGIRPLDKSREDKIKRRRRGSAVAGAPAAPPRPPAVDVYRAKVGMFPVKTLWSEIDMIVGDQPENLARWEQVVYSYVRCGWNRSNVGAMLDFFKRNEIPNTHKPDRARATPAERAVQNARTKV